MQCYRCKGKFVHEQFWEEEWSFFGLRCVNCGEIIDPLIIQHRLGRREVAKEKAPAPPPGLPFTVRSDSGVS